MVSVSVVTRADFYAAVKLNLIRIFFAPKSETIYGLSRRKNLISLQKCLFKQKCSKRIDSFSLWLAFVNTIQKWNGKKKCGVCSPARWFTELTVFRCLQASHLPYKIWAWIWKIHYTQFFNHRPFSRCGTSWPNHFSIDPKWPTRLPNTTNFMQKVSTLKISTKFGFSNGKSFHFFFLQIVIRHHSNILWLPMKSVIIWSHYSWKLYSRATFLHRLVKM